MNIYQRFKSLLSRREFLKTSTYISAGTIGFLLGLKPSSSRANTPGVTGNRVAWTHDSKATSWDGVTGYYGDYVDQARVNAMVERGIKELTGQSSAVSAWQQIIPDYSQGKKIAIKININNSGRDNYIDALSHPVNALIAGLKGIDVVESDIYVVEPSRGFPTYIGDPILALYPNVLLWDCRWCGTYGHKVTYTSGDPSLVVHHSHPDLSDSYLPDQLNEVTYLINMPIIKGHAAKAGITLTFKNNFGLFENNISRFHPYTYIDSPDYSYDRNPLHDIYLNPHVKDKTVLIIGDALFGHRTNNIGVPEVWNTFNGEFPNSFFFSTDPVAVDSVMWDFSDAEYTKDPDGQLYLHRAMELSLGTHEHWNNPTDKEYSNIDFKKIEMSAVGRLDIDRKVKDFKAGNATEQEVKDVIDEYMDGQ